jgi:tetratricopeptide (TPR) repeat protein
MKQFFLIIILLAVAAFAAGCSQSPADEAEQPTAESVAPELTTESITDPSVALEEGKRLLDENQTEKAIEFLRHAITLDPDLAEAHFQLGIAYALLEMQYEQEGRPVEEETANTNGGTRKTRSERAFERAVKAYEKWIDANPKYDVAYYNLGRTYSKLMKDEEAEKAFKEAVKIKPDDSEYQTELGAILIKLAKYREAIEPLKKAIELDPENVRAEELLEDAQAGRQRIDFVSPKPDANRTAANKTSNSNTAGESNSNSNSNTAPRPANSNIRPRTEPTKKPSPAANRP